MLFAIKLGLDAFIGIIGLVFGSFFNVCIFRIPKGESIAFPPSHCGNCKHTLRWYELIPVLSWIVLKGKCKECGEKISFQYPFIELLTGVVYIFLFIYFGFSIDTLKYLVLFSVLIIATVIDIKTQEVYFNVSLVGFIFGIIFNIIEIAMGKSIGEVIVSVGIPLVIMGIIYLVSRRIDGFGLGDVEIFLVIALYLMPGQILVAIFTSIIIGGVYSIILLARGYRGVRIAFVPFITVGALVAVVMGEQLVNWYIKLL